MKIINKIKEWYQWQKERRQYVNNLRWLSWELYESGWCKDMEKPKFPKPKRQGEWTIHDENTSAAIKQCYLTDFGEFDYDSANKNEKIGYRDFLHLIVEMSDDAQYLLDELKFIEG